MSALLHSQLSNHQHKRFICNRCLNSFKTRATLDKHEEYCKEHDAVLLKLPPKGTKLEFLDYHHSMRVPFVIYADFECFTEKIYDCSGGATEKFQHHKQSGFCYMVKCIDDYPWKPVIKKYTMKKEDDDVAGKFVESLEKTVRKIYDNISPHVRESGIRNPRNFSLWNPESSTRESGIQALESGIQFIMEPESTVLKPKYSS